MPAMGERRILRSRRVVTPEGERAAAVVFEGGRIRAVDAFEAHPAAEDLGPLVLLPGLVDSHVHCNDPGRADWEGFATATRAAAAGGITTLVDMPLNSIPATTTVAALAAKRLAARGRLAVDVGFWGGVVPGNAADLEALWEAGVLGFKCFLVPSGVDEFPSLGEDALGSALRVLARLAAPLLVHAELPGPIEIATLAARGDRRAYATYLATRPSAAEAQAIDLLARLDAGGPIHVVHVTSRRALEAIVRARRHGVAMTAETCPHYLTFAAEDIRDGATAWKCAPPIRSRDEREALWRALGDGTLDLVASDHSPSPPARKHVENGDFLAAWGGVASLQVALCAVWTGAAERGHGLAEVARWMGSAPAKLAGLGGRKGAIAPGCDADLVVFAPEASWTVVGTRLEHRHPLTPYEGLALRGRVLRTYLRGELVYDEGRFPNPTHGDLVAR